MSEWTHKVTDVEYDLIFSDDYDEEEWYNAQMEKADALYKLRRKDKCE